MKFILFGICLLCAVVVIEARLRRRDVNAENKDDDLKDWDTCYYEAEEDGHMRRFKCRSCCGEEGDQYCCDDDYDDSHEDDHHGKHGPHKVLIIVVGCLTAVVFVMVSISCCVYYMKYKKQQSSQLHPGRLSDVVVPTMQPESGKSPLSSADMYTGQDKEQLGITVVLKASPPYNTKY